MLASKVIPPPAILSVAFALAVAFLAVWRLPCSLRFIFTGGARRTGFDGLARVMPRRDSLPMTAFRVSGGPNCRAIWAMVKPSA
jgi:hypothetical protein